MKKIIWYSLRKKDILVNVGIIAGVWFMGGVVHDIIMHTVEAGNSNPTTFPMGTLFAIMALAFLSLFANWGDEMQMFTLSVSMGCTRKRFFTEFGLQYLALNVINWVALFLLNRLECWRLVVMFKNATLETKLTTLFHPATFVLVPLFVSALGLLIGGLGLRFGSNSRWIVIGAWIVLCLGISRVGNGTVLAALAKIPSYGYCLIALGITAIMFVIAVLLMRKQNVTV